MRIALRELCNVIVKLGFSRAFDEAVNGDTENNIFTEDCRVLAFFFRGNQKEKKEKKKKNKSVFIKFRL